MSGLDRLPENALTQAVRSRLSDVQEFKGSFQAVGSASVVTHRIFTEAAFDVQLTPPAVVGTLKVNQVEVEFIPDDLTLGGAFASRMIVEALNTDNQPLAGLQPEMERRASVDGRQIWSVYHPSFGYPGDTARLKFYFFATGSGTFTANVII